MSFPKSKRFEEIKSCAPPPGAYDPKSLDHTPGCTIEKSERFKMSKDGIKYGSDSALEVGPSPSATPKKALFKPPAAPVQTKSQKRDDVVNPTVIRDLKKELRTLVTEKTEIEKRLAGREADVVRLEARLQQVHKDKTALTAKLAAREKEMSSVAKSNVTLKSKMTANDASQSKTKTLQQELSSLQGEVDKHTKEAKHLREQLDRSKKDSEAAMEKSKSNLSKLQQESQTLEEERQKALSEIEKLKEEIEKLKKEKSAVEADRDAIRKELDEMKSQKEEQLGTVQRDMEERINRLTQEEALLNTNLESLTSKYNTLEENLESIQKEHDIKEGQLRREVAALKNSLAELQAANDQLGSVNMELMERLTKEKEEVALLEKKLVEAETITNDKYELLTNYLDSKSAEIDRLKAQVAEKQAEITKLKENLEAAQEASRSQLEEVKVTAAGEVGELKKSLEQRSLEEQDLRWQLEKALTQVVENQELVEVRQEELNAMRAQRDECDRETSEEMDVIREKMEQTRAAHKAEVEEYRQRLGEVERVSAIEQDELRRRSEAAETELMGMIKKVEEEMAEAEKASLFEIKELKKQLSEKEEAHQKEVERVRTDMAGCETAASKEISELKEQMDEVETSANKEIQSLVSRMAEMRLQNNEVIGELKAQVKEVKEERAILEESSRRALESEKTEKGQRVKELTTLKGDVEKLNQELDAERANNACAVRLLEEERDRSQEALEERNACIADLEAQLDDAENLLSSNVTTLEEELRKNTSQMERLHLQIEEAEKAAMDVERAANAEVDEIRAEMAKAEGVAVDQIRQFEQQVHAVQEESRREVSEISAMLDDVRHQYDTEVSSLSSRLQVRDEEIARLNAHLNDTQQVANSVKEKCTVLKAELTRLTEEHEAERAQLQEKHEVVQRRTQEDHQEQLVRLEQQHEQLTRNLQEEHEAELERNGSENGAQHHVDLQQMIRAHQELQEKYDALEKLVGPFQEQLEAFDSERQALAGSKANAEQEINKLSQDYAKLLGHQNQKQKIKHVLKLKQENNSLRQDLATTREELAKIKRQYERLDSRTRQTENKKMFDPTKAFHHAKENQTPPVSPLRPGNRI